MDPKQEKIIQKIEQKMKNQFGGESSGHDYWHLVRVKNLAQSRRRMRIMTTFKGDFLHNLQNP